VLKALEEGGIDRTLRNHMASCDICMNLALVSGWMGEFEKWSGGDLEEKTLPAADAIWQGAMSKVPSRRELSRKIMRILNFPKIWAILVVLVSGYFLAPEFLPRVFGSFQSLFGNKVDLTVLGSIFEALQKTLPYVILPLMLVLLFTLGVFFFTMIKPEKV
jgi:hypothetical protein